MAQLIRSLSKLRPRAIPPFSRQASTLATRKKKAETSDSAPHNQDASHAYRNISTATPHRPIPSPNRVVPLMQTFYRSASAITMTPAPASIPGSTMDNLILPSLFLSTPPEPPLRVPLLPDMVSPDRSVFRGEQPDAPLAAPEIAVVAAANPDNVLPVSALTEVEGMGIDGVELSFVHELEAHNNNTKEGGESREIEAGMLTDLWKGMIEDVFGGGKPKPT